MILSMGANSRIKLEQELQAVEARLAAGTGTLELQFQRAGLLAALGQIDDAKQRYLEILQQDPQHFETLIQFGLLLEKTNFRTAARTAYQQAVTHHPDKPAGYINLANLLLYAGELDAARTNYQTALQYDPDNIYAHQGLSLLYQQTGEDSLMEVHRVKGYAAKPVTTFPYVGNGEPVPLLLLISTMGGGDLPWHRFVDNTVFQVTMLATEFYNPTQPLPPHQLVFNTIGDADISRRDLEAAEVLLKQVTAPILNSPQAVLATGRMANAERLRNLPGVITPHIALLPRAVFADSETIEALLSHYGIRFPLLLRSPGFHTGQHFMYVETLDTLAAAASLLPRKQLLAMEYLDARGKDGFVRKYRVMMIDGTLYPLHLAISEQWKVHYFTADMAHQARHQVEEAEFLYHMPQVLGEKGMAALAAIQQTLGLDYGGVDFGIAPTGDLLVFEANATMKILPPSDDPQWDYRRQAIENALSAARRLVLSRAGLPV